MNVVQALVCPHATFFSQLDRQRVISLPIELREKCGQGIGHFVDHPLQYRPASAARNRKRGMHEGIIRTATAWQVSGPACQTGYGPTCGCRCLLARNPARPLDRWLHLGDFSHDQPIDRLGS